ncbi:hypothetical protein LCGC14_1350120, partial [marine sediment metagenome]
IAKRVQQVYTSEQIIRLDAGLGQSEFVTINRKTIDMDTGRISVERDIPSLRFDVEISDSPSTPTARASALVMLLDLIQKVPALAPALADIIVELTDIPDRDRVLQRVRAVMAQAGVPVDEQGQTVFPQPGPPQGGPETPGTTPRLVQGAAPDIPAIEAGGPRGPLSRTLG